MKTICRRITRRVSKMVATDDGRGKKTVPDGTESAYVEIEIDEDRLFETLGRQAMCNRSSKAVLGSGVVIARATRRERTPEPEPIPESERKVASAMLKALNGAMRDHL